MQESTKLIAIVGGSGAGKTWLARHLEQELEPTASCLSLDDFYRDHSQLPARDRAFLNFDHPEAIDWERFAAALQDCRAGRATHLPRYDFATHTRVPPDVLFLPSSVVIVEGLWLLVHTQVRTLFDFSIYLECPQELRLDRRLKRDVVERGRDPLTIQQQFWRDVAPMHDHFVAPQSSAADIILNQPTQGEIQNLAATIRLLLWEKSALQTANFPSSPNDITRTATFATIASAAKTTTTSLPYSA